MSSFNRSKGVIGHPMTPFDPYEQFKYVLRGPRTPRDICHSLMGQKGVMGHPMTPVDPYYPFEYVPRGPRTPRDIGCCLMAQRG